LIDGIETGKDLNEGERRNVNQQIERGNGMTSSYMYNQ